MQNARPPRIPPLTLPQVAMRFLRYGALAWGGPIAQIAMLRRELVDDQGWIDSDRFNRTLAVYQVLPGPEAQELTIYFGTLARGRLGGFLAGLCFLLPGFFLMLALSWFYVRVGITSPQVIAIFAACQAAVLALIVRGLYRLGLRAIHGIDLWVIAAASAVLGMAGVLFLVPLAGGAVSYALASRGHRKWGITALAIVFAGGMLAATIGTPAPVPSGVGPQATTSSAQSLLASGLKAGALTFGGAYTAIPFVEADATGSDGWMSRDQFLDGLVLSGLIPAPLVIFGTFVGYVGGGVLGALAMTIGIFLPAFAITLIGHRYLEAIVGFPPLHAVLDGVTAAVIGLVAATILALAPTAIADPLGIVIFGGSLVTLSVWGASGAVPLVILAAGFLGLISAQF